ncbi:hypothetical protein PLICRDRAFT_106062, partial [Plicaturopsis crispa FD-325 SS-3]
MFNRVVHSTASGGLAGNTVPDLERQANALEAKEIDLLQQLQDVRRTLASVRSRIGNLVNQRAPISRLPNETLVDILAYGDPSWGGKDSYWWPSSGLILPSHVIASHVSQRWRDLVLCTPLLWTCIWFRHERLVYPPGLLDAHIERSRACFLRI